MMEEDESQRPRLHVCLFVMCGLPGAGKTTLAKKLTRCNSLTLNCTTDSSSSSTTMKTSTSTLPTRAPTIKDPCVLLVQFDDIIPRELPVEKVVAGKDTDERLESVRSNDLVNKNERSTLWKQYRQDIHGVIERLLNGVTRSYQNSQSLTHRKSLQAIVKSTLEPPSEENDINRTVLKGIRDAIRRHDSGSEMTDTDVRQEGCDDVLVLVLDDNMYYRSMRFEYYQLARKYETGFAQIYIQCPASIAMARNESREYPVTMDTITNMSSNLEVPDSVKAPWEEYTAVIDAEKLWNDDDMKRIWCVIEQALAKPAPPYQEIDTKEQDESRRASLASVVHQADVILRKSVAEVIKTKKSPNQPSKQELQQLARTLNSLRTAILNEIRHGQLDVPPLFTCEERGTDQIQNQNFHDFIREHFQLRFTNVCQGTTE